MITTAKAAVNLNGEKTMDQVHADLDRYFEREEYLTYLNEELEKSMIQSPAEAMEIILDQMFRGKNQSYEVLATATKFLADHFKIGNDIDFDESEITMTYDKEVEKKVEKEVGRNKEDNKRMLKWVRDIEHEVYGEDSLDTFSIDGALSSLSWILGMHRPSNKNVNIKRKV